MERYAIAYCLVSERTSVIQRFLLYRAKKILSFTETIEEGGLNVFQFIDPASLLALLPGRKVLQNAFQLSLKNTDSAPSILEDLLSVDDCPKEVYPFVLSCIENIKPKLSNEEKLAVEKVESKLTKKAAGKIENDSKSTENTQSLYFALKHAIKKNRVKESLKEQIRNTLHSIFVVRIHSFRSLIRYCLD